MKIENIVISDNLVPDLDEQTITDVKRQIKQQFEDDDQSMSDWSKRYEKAMALARMDSDKIETRLKGGCKLMMPYIMEMAIDFNARVVMEVLSRDDVVFADIRGKVTEEKEARGKRVTEYANYEVHKSGWRDVTDSETLSIPISGTTYKKVWIDDITGYSKFAFIQPDKIVFSHKVKRFCDAPQVAEIMEVDRNTIVSMKRAGLWEIDLDDLDEEKTSFECHEIQFEYDFDDDGYAEPYIGMYIKDLDTIMRIVPNFEPEGIRFNRSGDVIHIEKNEYLIQKQLLPDPEGKPMGLGFGILLSDIFETININTRQMTDAATLQNLGNSSGLIAHGVQPRGNQAARYDTGEIEIEMGVFKQVQVTGGQSLSQSVVQFPFGGPSPVLFQLMTHLEDAARRMSMAGQGIEAQAGEAASMYLAKLQQAMKSPNAMIWRLCQGFEKEFSCMFKLLYQHADNDRYMTVVDEEANILIDMNPDDCDIVPTLSPNQGSDWERMMRADAQLQAAKEMPQLHNLREAYLRYYEALGVDDVESLLPEPDPNAVDPMQQLQMQYLAMDAEFRNREMMLKEGKLALDKMKAVGDMREQMMRLQMDMEKAPADKAKTISDAIKNLAAVADMEERKALFTIEQMVKLDQQKQQRYAQMTDEQLLALARGQR